MPVNWSDQGQIDQFKSYLLSTGAPADQVDSFLSANTATASAAPAVPMSVPKSSAAQSATDQTVNASVSPAQAVPFTPHIQPSPTPPPPGDPNAQDLVGKSGNLLQMAEAKKSAQASAAPAQSKPYDPTGKTQAQIMAETGQQSSLDSMRKAGNDPDKPKPVVQAPAPQQPSFQPAPTSLQSDVQSPQKQDNPIAPAVPNLAQSTPQNTPATQPAPQQQLPQQPQQPDTQQGNGTGTILPKKFPITQNFGNYNPNVEVYSRGYARDTNFAAPMGTPISLPPGTWRVDRAYNAAPPVGGPRNGENQGYGNMVKVVDTKTGNSMIMQHLSDAQLKQGQTYNGGTLVGHTGMSGNATGPNLGIEYQDSRKGLQNITNSMYAPYLFGGS